MTLFSTIVASLYIFLEFLYFLGNICIRPISKIHVVKSYIGELSTQVMDLEIYQGSKD